MDQARSIPRGGRCSRCRRRGARHTTVSGRALCDRCYRDLATYAGAGTAMVDGASPGEAVGTGLAAGQWAGAVRDDAEAARRRRAKLAHTTGFWRRLWVRVWG